MARQIRKISIIGISGTGKSALGRRIATKTSLPLYHMDSIIWSRDWTETTHENIFATLSKIVATESWIVEGWIDTYSKDILQQADTILYLDYPGWTAAYGGLLRWWEHKGRKRPEMPEGCQEKWDPHFLKNMLLRKERPHIEGILATMPQTNIIRSQSRQETEAILSDLFPH